MINRITKTNFNYKEIVMINHRYLLERHPQFTVRPLIPITSRRSTEYLKEQINLHTNKLKANFSFPSDVKLTVKYLNQSQINQSQIFKPNSN